MKTLIELFADWREEAKREYNTYTSNLCLECGEGYEFGDIETYTSNYIRTKLKEYENEQYNQTSSRNP